MGTYINNDDIKNDFESIMREVLPENASIEWRSNGIFRTASTRFQSQAYPERHIYIDVNIELGVFQDYHAITTDAQKIVFNKDMKRILENYYNEFLKHIRPAPNTPGSENNPDDSWEIRPKYFN